MEECLKCGKAAEIQQTEILPDGGILEMAIHEDGTAPHKWSAYDSLEGLQRYHEKNKTSQTMKCPRCGKKGVIHCHHHNAKTFINNDGKRENTPEDVLRVDARYYIRHEGDQRCIVFTPEEREKVLKKLGRYISTPRSNIN